MFCDLILTELQLQWWTAFESGRGNGGGQNIAGNAGLIDTDEEMSYDPTLQAGFFPSANGGRWGRIYLVSDSEIWILIGCFFIQSKQSRPIQRFGAM